MGYYSARAAGCAIRRAEIKNKAASFEEDTVVPLSAALLDGGFAASSGLSRNGFLHTIPSKKT